MEYKTLLKEIKSNTYCRLQPSTIEGVGVFAIKKIPKNTNPFKGCIMFGHMLVPEHDIDKLPKAISTYIKDMCVMENGHYTVPKVGLNALDVSFYINHSVTPNMSTNDGGFFYAIRDIAEGEELTVDYRTYNDDEDLFKR